MVEQTPTLREGDNKDPTIPPAQVPRKFLNATDKSKGRENVHTGQGKNVTLVFPYAVVHTRHTAHL